MDEPHAMTTERNLAVARAERAEKLLALEGQLTVVEVAVLGEALTRDEMDSLGPRLARRVVEMADRAGAAAADAHALREVLTELLVRYAEAADSYAAVMKHGALSGPAWDRYIAQHDQMEHVFRKARALATGPVKEEGT